MEFVLGKVVLASHGREPEFFHPGAGRTRICKLLVSREDCMSLQRRNHSQQYLREISRVWHRYLGLLDSAGKPAVL